MLLLLLCTTIALLSIVPLDAHPHFHTGQEIGTVWHATSDDSTPPPILSYHAHIVFNLNKHHYDRAMALRDRTIFQFQDYLMGEECTTRFDNGDLCSKLLACFCKCNRSFNTDILFMLSVIRDVISANAFHYYGWWESN